MCPLVELSFDKINSTLFELKRKRITASCNVLLENLDK